jgi:hypothetical protein
MTKARAIERARELMGELWSADQFDAKRSVKAGWLIYINKRQWMSLGEMEEAGPMSEIHRADETVTA